MFAPVYPVMVVEGRDNGKVLVDAYQESCQQGGEGDQGGCTSNEVAQGCEHMWSILNDVAGSNNLDSDG